MCVVHSKCARCIKPFSLVLLYLSSLLCGGQTRKSLCSDGYGAFDATFFTGVTVSVGAAHKDELLTRVCRADLSWGKQKLLIVPNASQVDIDTLGADLGLGTLVVSFQVRKLDTDLGMEYQIYSLQKPPRLLRTITGGSFFSAADTDLDGKIEIWTDDAGAVDGFENLKLAEIDFAPTIVLRFENQRLIDVSSEFRSYFDHQIERVRTRLDSGELNEFRRSDGKLSANSSLPVEQLRRLHDAKLKVLEIVWCYLYSGREQDAWKTLSRMWPPADLERIRAALVDLCARGIRRQVDGTSPGPPPIHLRHYTHIFRTQPNPDEDLSANSAYYSPMVDTKPQQILLLLPAPTDMRQPLTESAKSIDLVIDAAGKVRSAKPVGTPNDELTKATQVWKFIPAFKGRWPVACNLRLDVVPLR